MFSHVSQSSLTKQCPGIFKMQINNCSHLRLSRGSIAPLLTSKLILSSGHLALPVKTLLMMFTSKLECLGLTFHSLLLLGSNSLSGRQWLGCG